MGKQIPTVSEVASMCGVSVATVSRVLNSNFSNGFSVRKELGTRIKKVADDLGYRPNITARSLAQQQTKVVDILGCNTVFGWPSNIYQSAVEAAVRYLQNKEYDVCFSIPNFERHRTELPPWKVDGVIVLQECSQETIEQMEKIQLPYVVVNGVGGPSCPSVIPDDVEATHKAVDHLLELGHRRIAYAGPTSEHRTHASISLRHDTLISKLKESGLEILSGHDAIFNSGLDFLVSTVLKQKATAILAYDHVVSLKILHDAHLLNIEIPKQVSLICFNDGYLCDMVMPPLTTIGLPTREMGEKAAEALFRLMTSTEEDHKTECFKVKQNLIIRSSTTVPYGNN